MDVPLEGRVSIIRSGHWPLLWLLLPVVLGYALGAGLPVAVPVWWPLIAGCTSILTAFTYLKRSQNGQSAWWCVLYLFGVILLAWAYWILREPSQPQGTPLPPREATIGMRVERLFAGVRSNGQLSGLGRIETVPPQLTSVSGQRVFFNAWPEAFAEAIAPGAVVKIRGKLGVVETAESPYDFNAFLIRSGVYYQMEYGVIEGVQASAPDYELWARSLNVRLREGLLVGVTSERQQDLAGISIAMLLGRKEALDYQLKERFIESGTMHLFAVSGLHIGILAAVLFYLFDSVRIPRPLGAVLGLVVLGVYVLVVGKPPSAIRAYLMVIFFWGAILLKSKPSPMSALLSSASVVLLFNPQELLRPGFQLSYAVVGGILMYGVPIGYYLAERWAFYQWIPPDSLKFRQRYMAKLWRWCLLSFGVSLAATVFSTPLTVAMFGVVSPGAIVLNIFLLPIASVALVVSAMTALLSLLGIESLSILINHIAWVLNGFLERMVSLGLMVPGLFHRAEWRSLRLAPIFLCLLFLSYLMLLQRRILRAWQFWVPPSLLVGMLVIGLRLV